MSLLKVPVIISFFSTVTTISTLVSKAAAVANTACTDLASSLGSSKVNSNPLSANYINSRYDYWNAVQSNYAPSCIVYPESAQDVSTALRAIKLLVLALPSKRGVTTLTLSSRLSTKAF